MLLRSNEGGDLLVWSANLARKLGIDPETALRGGNSKFERRFRRLEALLAVASVDRLLLISGTGDVIEPDDEILAIGSGGPYALAAARAMVRHAPDMDARSIVEQSLLIASEICIYTNDTLTIIELDASSST